MKNIGQKIKDIRKQKGLSQEELAELSKINLRTIQRIKTQKMNREVKHYISFVMF